MGNKGSAERKFVFIFHNIKWRLNNIIHAYVKLCFIGFINVLVSTEYKTYQKHTIYHKTTKTQTQQGKI
jgi:hypothetical protein